jgi:hypothetical protein
MLFITFYRKRFASELFAVKVIFEGADFEGASEQEALQEVLLYKT